MPNKSIPSKKVITTDNAPAAIGPYSQAINVNNTIYLSGQIALDPQTMVLCNEGIESQINQVFKNIEAVANAAGGDLSHIVKMTVYLTDLSHFVTVNELMAERFISPYPARAAVGVTELPKGAAVEIDAIMVL